MTVSTQVSRNEYTGNGATTQYDFTFRILDKSHLLVQMLDTSESIVTLTLGTDYTVTGVNRYNGGKVVLTSALPAGYKISIERSTPVTQEASIRNQGGFFPEIHEDALDKLTMLVQQAYGWWSGLSLRKPSWLANYYDALNNRIRNLRDPSQAQDAATKNYVDSTDNSLQQQIASNFKRSLRVPDSSINQLPSAEERAWKGLGFDGAGQPKLQDPAGTGLWGYVPVSGSFENGGALRQRFEVLLWESTQEYWRWDGALPKTVPAGSAPETAGGTGKGKWIDVTDATLRANLGSSEGFKLVGQFGSVDELRGYSPSIDGESVLVKSYNPGWAAVSDSPRGGGEFYYDANDTSSADDGVFTFVTTGGHRLKRKGLNGVISLAQAGAPVDGISNADEAFSRLHNAIISRTDLWRVDGENLTYVRTTPLLQDISRYSVNNMYLMYTGVTDFGPDNPFYAWKPSDSIGTSKRTFTRKMKNVTFHGPGYRIDTNIHALLLHMQTESETLRQMKFENVNVRDFNKGHVYGDHAYLITFENCNIWRCYAGLSDREIVEGASLTDSGENIRYVECLLDSLHQCAHLGTQELNITFDTTSFDYTGRTSAESFIQWIIGGTHEITLRDCFIESGNVNAGWYNYGFYTTAAANIRIVRGIIRLVSTTYNTCPSFFYDASGLASFEIDGTTINGWGVKKWANTGLRKFRPTLKGLTSQFTLHTTDDPILWNPAKVNNLDYQVRALTSSTYTDKYTNERIKVVPSSITKDDGTVIPTLLVTKLAGYGQFADFIVKVRKPVKVDHNASMHGKITFVPGTAMSSARVITAITGCCTPGKVNNVGVMSEFASITITSTQLSLLDSVNWYDINASWGANKSASFLTFEEDMIRLDLSNLALGDAIHVHSLQWFGAF